MKSNHFFPLYLIVCASWVNAMVEPVYTGEAYAVSEQQLLDPMFAKKRVKHFATVPKCDDCVVSLVKEPGTEQAWSFIALHNQYLKGKWSCQKHKENLQHIVLDEKGEECALVSNDAITVHEALTGRQRARLYPTEGAVKGAAKPSLHKDSVLYVSSNNTLILSDLSNKESFKLPLGNKLALSCYLTDEYLALATPGVIYKLSLENAKKGATDFDSKIELNNDGLIAGLGSNGKEFVAWRNGLHAWTKYGWVSDISAKKINDVFINDEDFYMHNDVVGEDSFSANKHGFSYVSRTDDAYPTLKIWHYKPTQNKCGCGESKGQ